QRGTSFALACAIAGRGVARIKLEQRHHEARRAEAALRTVARHHRLLRRMQRSIALPQAFDREERLAVEHRNELQTGVYRAGPDFVAVELGDDDGACTAVAFGTAFLGTGAAQVFAKIVEDRLRRFDV